MNAILKQYRQGDVFLNELESLPNDTIPALVAGQRVVLQQGTATGHAHVMRPEHISAFVSGTDVVPVLDALTAGNQAYLVVKETTELTHEEHAAIAIEPGVYQVIRQREYSPAENVWVND